MTEASEPVRAADVDDGVSPDGVFEAVRDGGDAVYEVLAGSSTFNRIWRTNAYGGEFPEDFAHIGFLTLPEARRMLDLLKVRAGSVVVDAACGTGGPGLWVTQASGASLIGIDTSAHPVCFRDSTRLVRIRCVQCGCDFLDEIARLRRSVNNSGEEPEHLGAR